MYRNIGPTYPLLVQSIFGAVFGAVSALVYPFCHTYPPPHIAMVITNSTAQTTFALTLRLTFLISSPYPNIYAPAI